MKKIMMQALALGLFLASPLRAETTEKTNSIEFVNKLENDKKVWVPSTKHLKPGKVEITITNTLKDPHGFTLALSPKGSGGTAKTVVEPLIIAGNETKKVTVDLTAGEYDFKCQMHPAHVGGQLEIKP